MSELELYTNRVKEELKRASAKMRKAVGKRKLSGKRAEEGLDGLLAIYKTAVFVGFANSLSSKQTAKHIVDSL